MRSPFSSLIAPMNTKPDTNALEHQGSFEEIEAAVRETERGRWFLDEYRRRLQPETRELLGSLRRIERAMHAGPGSPVAAMSAMSDKLRSLRRIMPIMAEVSARAATETGRAAERLRSLALLEDEDYTKPDNRLAMRAETERLKMLVHEMRAVAENLGRANGALAAMDSDLAGAFGQAPHNMMPPPPQPQQKPNGPTQTLGQALGQSMGQAVSQTINEAASQATNQAAPQQSSIPVDSFSFPPPEPKPAPEAVKDEKAEQTEPQANAETPVSTAEEKPRIVVSHGSAMPPMPEDDGETEEKSV